MHSTRRRAVRWLAVAVLLAVPLAACAGDDPAPADTATTPDSPTSPTSDGETTPDGEAPADPAEPDPATETPSAPAEAAPPAPPSPDQLAGLLSREVPASGDGELVVVPGVTSAPAEGDLWQVRVSVEGGLDVEGQAFADLVMATLNDPRGWSNDGFTFARTDTDDYDVEVVLASPDTSTRLCEPLVTYGKLSCRNGDQAVITLFRWVNGTEDYADDLTGYRQYVVQHEVGHALGYGHVECPAPGEPAPLMMQQTLGLDGCIPNAWPFP